MMSTPLKNDASVLQTSAFEEHRFSAHSVAEVHNIITDLKKTSDVHHTLMLFDIDETLVQQKDTHYGSHEWFSHSIEYFQKKGLPFEEARLLVLPLRLHYHHHNDLELADEAWPELLEHLNEENIGRIVLTRRTQPMAELTGVWCERLNLNFSEDYFGDDCIVALEGDTVVSHKGKLFCGNNTKGGTLFHFMKLRHEIKPYQGNITVILIDDREEYFPCVAQSLKQFAHEHTLSITFYGIHFTALHDKFKDFSLSEEDKAILDTVYEEHLAEKK